MTIAVQWSGSALANSIGIGPHQVGDLLLGFGYNDAQSTAVTLPSGWIDRYAAAVGSVGHIRIGYKIATTASENSGTWTNADQLFILVLRGAAKTSLFPNFLSTNSVTSTTITYAAQTAGTYQTNADDQALISWVVSRNATNVLTAPTGLTEEIAATDSVNFGTQVCKQLSRTSLFATQNVTVGTTALYRTVMLSIVESKVYGATGGSFNPFEHPLLG